MKFAVLADLHANYPALNAVFDDLPAGVDTVVYLGDFIGVMGFPQETVAAVREHADYAVKGNHDVAVLERNEGHVNSRSLSEFELEHTKANLTDEQADWITGLQAYAELPERELLLPHAQDQKRLSVSHPETPASAKVSFPASRLLSIPPTTSISCSGILTSKPCLTVLGSGTMSLSSTLGASVNQWVKPSMLSSKPGTIPSSAGLSNTMRARSKYDSEISASR